MIKKFKKCLKKLSKKSYTFRTIYNYAKKVKRRNTYQNISKSTEVDPKLVIFESFFAKKYACSPRAIYEYMLQNPEYNEYRFVWAFRKPDEYQWLEDNGRTTLVQYDSKRYFEYYAEAKYWVTNSRLPEEILRKEDQVYIQCWHGTPLKRLGYDIEGPGGNTLGSTKKVRKQYSNDAKRYSYMLSPSPFCTEKFTSAFNLKELFPERNIIVEEGYPRNDFLSNFTEKDVEQIKERLELPKDKKVILYAPTWRDNQHVLGKGFTLDVQLDLKEMQKALGDEYIVLMRLHYLIANHLDLEGVQDFAYDVSKLDDINDLYAISDMLITDYSSVFFDYAILKRPMMFYMYDLEEYKNDIRDFYIDLEELPGPIVETQESLVEEILNSGGYNRKYQQKYSAFNEKFNSLEDGQAARRVVEYIMAENK